MVEKIIQIGSLLFEQLLKLEDYWNVVKGTENDEKKDVKGFAKIILYIDKVNYSHVKGAKSAKEAWKALERAFEDSGLTRRVGLLCTLVTTKLADCQSVEEYCDTIISTAYKLNDIGLKRGRRMDRHTIIGWIV